MGLEANWRVHGLFGFAFVTTGIEICSVSSLSFAIVVGWC